MSSRLLLALEAVRRHYCAYGCSPSFRELGAAIGVPRQRVSAIVRELVVMGAVGFTSGTSRSITLPDPLETYSTSQLLLALQDRGLLVQVVPASSAIASIANVYALPIVTEYGLSEQDGNDDLSTDTIGQDRPDGQEEGGSG